MSKLVQPEAPAAGCAAAEPGAAVAGLPDPLPDGAAARPAAAALRAAFRAAACAFPAPIAIVDLETTGGSPTADRITEIGVVRMQGDRVIDEWSSLVDPGVSIPPEIQRLTGITNAMVRGAPAFEALAEALAERLAGHLFVAHNARFDYGFLKNAFARAQQAFTADVLCTVRLSRRLTPQLASHGLDSLVSHWQLAADGRHRALGDARLVARLIELWHAAHGAAPIAQAVRTLLKIPSLPPQLAPDSLDGIPDTPGVYVFHGVNDLPLYVGKSVSLRERIRSHFSSDYRHANDARLSAEVRRISWEPTAGELGALLLEARWVKSRFPLLNRALRANQAGCVIDLSDADAPPALVPVGALEPARLAGHYGPFKDKRAARAMLQKLAAECGLCWNLLGLESRAGPCFARQVRKCAGACVGAEPREAHRERLAEALAPWRLPAWPYEGAVAIREQAVDAAGVGCEAHWHLVEHWCHLGTARSEHELGRLAGSAPAARFDADVYRLLRAHLGSGRVQVFSIG